MGQLTLTMLDTSGIQHYIFNSNRLQENIGASELVYRATTLWAFEVLPVPHNVSVQGSHWKIRDGDIEQEGSPLRAEVVYAGGGKTMILFKSREEAVEFTGRITTRVLREAPGLDLLAWHLEFDPDSMSLAAARSKVLGELAARKQSRRPSVPLLGLGVSAVCQSTGLPAVWNDTGTVTIASQREKREVHLRLKGQEAEPPRLISRETAAKLAWRDMATERLKEVFGDHPFPSDIDMLGRLQGEESYVAVIHADGNRMGEHLESAVQGAETITSCKQALRAFSEKVNAAGLTAVRQVVDLVAAAVKEERIPHEEGVLPIRPLVFGGDDVILLSNGQIGVSLAAAYLEAFEKAFHEPPVVKGLENVHARAGIAIVKMHYPFARAYQLSEDLARSAKKFIRTETNGDCSAFDWHYATGGLSGELKVIRDREYQVNGKLLTLRPVRIDQGDQRETGRYWRNGLEEVLLRLKNDPYWSGRKNKVVGLREPLRKGPEAVQTYRRNFDIALLPELAGPAARETGWQGGRCIYFDAVELFDHYLPLEEKEVRA